MLKDIQTGISLLAFCIFLIQCNPSLKKEKSKNLMLVTNIFANPSLKKEKSKNLMLVTNIFAFSMDAEKSVAYWRKNFLQAFIMQCDIYMGCKH